MKNSMLIKKQKQFNEMTTDELVSFVKSETNDTQTGYVLFAKYRIGLPELDAKEFNRRFKEAIPDTFIDCDYVVFNPTHVNIDYGMKIQLERIENGAAYFITEYGGFGSEPEQRFYKFYKSINKKGVAE